MSCAAHQAAASALSGILVGTAEAVALALAIAIMCGWRPGSLGRSGGMAFLGGGFLSFGPISGAVTLDSLQMLACALLLLFGFGWLTAADSFAERRALVTTVSPGWLDRQRQRRHLAELDDERLADIGVSREQAIEESRRLD